MEKITGIRGLVAVLSLFAAVVLAGCNQSDSKPTSGNVSPSDDKRQDDFLSDGACEAGSVPGIIHGTPIHPGFELVPSIVRVYSVQSDGNANVCTGTLLDNETVLTAAHCVNDMYEADKILVHFHHDPACEPDGLLNKKRDRNLKASRENIREAAAFIVHRDYNTDYFINDLAIIKLAKAAPSTARPVAIGNWMTTTQTDRARVLAIGYGKITRYDNQEDPNHRLRYGYVKPLLQEARRAKLVAHMSDRGLRDTSSAFVDRYWLFFDQTDGNGVCAGDSGGPAFVKVGGKWTQVGVASFVTNVSSMGGEVCKDIGAHVNLSGYTTWIEGARRYLRFSTGRNTY